MVRVSKDGVYMSEELDQLKGFTPYDLMEHLRESGFSEWRCSMCGHDTINIIGTAEQLFFFQMKASLTDTESDTRGFDVAMAVCDNCAHVHLYSCQDLAKKLKQKQKDSKASESSEKGE